MFIAALFTIAKKWKQPKSPSVDEWIKKMWYIYTMEYSAIRRKQILPFATTWMELVGIMLSEISQVEKDKHQVLQSKTEEQNSSRLTDSKKGVEVTKGKGTGEDGWEGRDKGRERGAL